MTKNSKIKYLSDKYFSPTMTVVFGDYVASFVWDEPYHALLIKSKPMAESHRSYFEQMWKVAKN